MTEKPEDEVEFAVSFSNILETIQRPFKNLLRKQEEVIWDESDEYDFSHARRGTMLVFNNEVFKKHTARPGSSIDVSNIVKTFTKHGFDVQTHENQTRNQMLNTLKKVARSDHSDADCFACVILSHGDYVHVFDKSAPDRLEKEDLVYATDQIILTKEIVELFTDNKAPTLVGKPRLFLIQACRGDELDSGVSLHVAMDEVDASKPDTYEVVPCPIYKDFLIMYATPPGFYAFRRPDTGSWFVRGLCHVFSQPVAKEMKLTSLLTTVIWYISNEYESSSANRKITGKKQTPCIATMLVKDVYFRQKSVEA